MVLRVLRDRYGIIIDEAHIIILYNYMGSTNKDTPTIYYILLLHSSSTTRDVRPRTMINTSYVFCLSPCSPSNFKQP